MGDGESGFRVTALGNGATLLEPGHGINPSDPGATIKAVLTELNAEKSKRLYFDLSGVAIIDPVYYSFLNRLASSCQALDIAMICTGIRPHTAYALAVTMNEPPQFATTRVIDQG